MLCTYRILRGSGTCMIREQEEYGADRKHSEVDVCPLDETDLLRHLGQLEPWMALDEGERPLLLSVALFGDGGEPAVDKDLIPLPLVAQDAGHHPGRYVGLGARSQL